MSLKIEVIMGGKRGNTIQEDYRKKADASRDAVVEDPLLVARRNKILRFNKQVDDGVDISQIDALKPNTQLYNSAINRQGDDRQSTGIFNLARGGNSDQAQRYDRYMQMKRQQDAAGQLENAFNATSNDLNNESYRLGGMSDSRNMGKAGMAQQAYATYLNRPRGGILSTIMPFIMGGAQAGATAFGKGCWIAEAIYGVDDPRTHLVRWWLNFEFTKTLFGRVVMAFYLSFGERIARQVKKHSFLCRMLKPLFDKALTRAGGSAGLKTAF